MNRPKVIRRSARTDPAGSSPHTGGRIVVRRSLLTLVATSMFLASPAIAAWTTAGSGAGGSRAVGIGAGNAPSATVTGDTVDLTWDAGTLSNGDPVTDYLVARYDSDGTQQVIALGSCATNVSGTTCSETSTPNGTWKYAVTPVYEGWKGQESPKTTVAVGVPTLTLSASAAKSETTLSGTIENFTGGGILRFRLDSVSGTELSGTVDGTATPAAIPLSGSAPVTVDIPPGTSEGPHTIHAVVDVTGESASMSITVDDTPPPAPTLTSTPSDPTTATNADFEFGDPESGVTFECRLDGGTYAGCSSPASYTGLSDGGHTFDVRAVDGAGNRSAATSFSWTIDTFAPAITIDFPVAGSAYNTTTFNDGCGTSSTGDVCGTAGSGAEDVRVSIRKGTGNYWDGTGFSSATEVLFTASGTTNWSYGFAGASFPSDDSYTLRAVTRDLAGNTRSASTTFAIDRTAPSGSDIQTANASGGTVGKAETGDTITFTYSERIDPTSVLAGWNGSATNVVVRINHRVNLLLVPETDILQVWNAANTAQLPLGAVDLGATDYVSANVTFGATGTPATMVQNGSAITVTLGTPNTPGAVTTALLDGSMTWTPGSGARDLAGNNSLTSPVTESGSSDKEF
jgi:hypothetical protein